MSATALCLLVASSAVAAPQSIPNGPWVQESQAVKLERLHDYEELVAALRQIERSTHGAVQLEVIGQSNEGRDIYLAKVGSGDTKVMYLTQQHGNEPLGTEAALQLLKRLGSSGNPEIRQILEEITLLVVVRVNPDGSERFWRQNYDPDASGPFHAPGRGFDVNRYHHPAMTPETNPVPEAAAVRRAYDRYQPEIVVDYHHQGSYVAEDGDLIRTSVFWPSAAGVSPEALALSKQVTVVIADTLSHYGFAEVSQYPGGTFAGIARNAYGLLGSGSVLVELRGGIGQKSSGYLMRTAYVSMLAILEAAGEGWLYEIDPARADLIPPRGPAIRDPHE